MSCCFDINIASIIFRQRLNLFVYITFPWIKYQIRPEFFGFFQSSILHVQNDQKLGILHSGISDHSKAKRSGSRDNHNVFIGYASAVYRMLGTSIWFYQKGLFNRHIFRYTANDTVLRVSYILCHASVIIRLEAQHIMRLAHPVMSVFTEPALSARNNLVGNDPVAQFVSLYIFSHFNNSSKKFMTWNEWRFYPGRLHLISPEHRCSMAALQISGADSTGLCLDDNIIRATNRRRIFRFKPVIILGISNQSFHCFWRTSFVCHTKYHLSFYTSNCAHTVSSALLTARYFLYFS